MPARISRLYELAYNLWWSWHPEARVLYSTLDPELWERVGHNPVRFLSEVEPYKLEQAAENAEYLQQYDSVVKDFDHYRSEEHTSELQSRLHLVCRLLLEKKNNHHMSVTTL